MDKKTICGLYTRVSSRNQMEPEYNSLETQKERLEAYCKAQGYEVYRIYEDGAYSGDSIDRPALKQMMADMQAGLINCVVTYKIDRLTRSVRDFHQLMDVFDRSGATFVSVTQNIDTLTPTGRLMRNILLDFAQFEREMTSDRTRDKMQQRAQKGMWNGGIPPYGYTKKEKKLCIEKEEANHVRFAYEYFAKTPSLAGLRDEMAAKGWRNRAGQPWSKTALAHILGSPVYCGQTKYQDKVFQGEHEAIVGDALFEKCQVVKRLYTHPTARTERTFLLRGLLHCQVCGSAMTPTYTGKSRKSGERYNIPYYRCTKTMHFNNGLCSVKSVNALQLEQAVINGLSEISANEKLIEDTIADVNRDLAKQAKPLVAEIAGVKKRLAEIETELTRYVKAVGKGTVSVKRLETQMKELEKEEKLLLASQEELQRKINESLTREYDARLFKRSLTDFNRVFKNLEPKEQAETLQSVLKGILVHSDKLELDIFELPDLVPIGSKKSERWLPGLDSNQRPSETSARHQPVLCRFLVLEITHDVVDVHA